MSIGILETVKVSGFECPSCGERLFAESSVHTACPKCRWTGEAHILKALREKAEPARDALSDQAVCAFHPTKQATTICEGTGDYICSLCAVEVAGKVYSAQYLGKAGKDTLDKTYARYLDRPDKQITIYLALSIFLLLPAPVLIPMAIYKFFAAIKLRKSDPMFNKAFSRVDLILHGFLVLFFTVAYTLGAIAIFL